MEFNGTDADDTITVTVTPPAESGWQVSGGGSRVTSPLAPAGVVINGQGGIDTLVLDDTANARAERFVLTDAALSRVGAGDAVAYSRFENVTLEGGSGATDVTVKPSRVAQFMVRGNDPGPGAAAGAGDTLRLDLDGVSGVGLQDGAPGNGTYTFANRGEVVFRGFESQPSVVLGRHVIYGRGPFADNGFFDPESAIAPDKVALLPGQGAGTFANVTSFNRGINGLAIDVAQLPLTAEVGLAMALELKVGTGGDPATWADAPRPEQIDLRPGHGVDGSDRILLFWRDGAIRNTWLRVTLPSHPFTGNAAPDVFYFGNLVGETGDRLSPLRVSSADLANTRRNFSPPGEAVPPTNPYDFNRDGKVNALDLAIDRANVFHALGPIREPAPAGAAAAALPPLWDEAPAELLA